ncbi:MAG: TonB-dependent receptor, partial [Flavobacteriaceae bacterium]|nr:TonB-dependent receptor [Flavobacteriaceae bacterium]
YLVPEKFKNSDGTSASLNSTFQSNTIGFTNSLGVKTTSRRFRFLARGSYNTQSDYKTGGGLRVTDSRFNDKDFKAGFKYDNANFLTEIRYNYNLANNGIPNAIGEQSTSKEMEGVYQNIANHIISAKNNIYFKTFTLKTDLGFTNHQRKLFKNDTKSVDMYLNTLNYNINAHLLNTGTLETIFGIQGMYQANKNNIETIFLPDATTIDFGIFATTNYDFKKHTLQLGVRFDNRSITTDEHGEQGNADYFAPLDKNLNSFTGAAGIKSDLSKNLTSRINLALGFRAPNLSELTSNGLHAGQYEIGNNTLENEKNFQIDLNLEYAIKNLEFFINGYYNKINNYIYLEPTGEIRNNYDVFTYNQQDAELYGGEAGLHTHPENYKWLHLRSSSEYVRGKTLDGGDLPRIPGFTIKNNARMVFDISNIFRSAYLEINNKNVFEQTRISVHETPGQAYSLFDVGLGTDVHFLKLNAKFFININNLFDRNYIDHLSVLKEENIANQGQNIVFGVNFNI